jgi:hypothetical protein
MSGSLSATASNSLLLDGTGSVGFTITASFTAVSSSQQQISASLLTISRSYATTGSNTFTGVQNFSNTCNPIGFNSVASLYTAGGLQVSYDSYFSSSVFVNGNLTVFGTQSVVHVSSSQFNIGTNIITVNTATPSIRYGGLSVYDSGSTGLSGSIFWDSEANHWIYANASGSGGGDTYTGGMFISGPRNTRGLGCEQGTTSCMLLVGQGGDHLTSSMIYHSSTVTCVPGIITGGSDILLSAANPVIYGGTAVGGATISNNTGASYIKIFGASHATTPNTTTFINANSTVLTISNTGKVYIGTSAFCWTDTAFKTLQIGNGAINNIGNQTQIVNNIYYDDVAYRYLTAGTANRIIMAADGNIQFEAASSGNPGCAVTLCARMFICGNNGNVGIGCSTPLNRLTVNGNIGMPNTYNWGVVNDNDPNWGFKVCTSGANYSTFVTYAGDQGSDRRGGIYNQNGHWVAYGNCVGHFIVQCNLCANANLYAAGGITAGGAVIASSILSSTTQNLVNSTGGFAKMVHKIQGASGAFSSLVICVNLIGPGGWGYIINSGGTGLGQFQSGGGYINGPGNFSHGVAVGSGFTVTCHTCSGTDNIVRFVSSGGVHPFVSVQMFGSLNQAFDDNNIFIAYS